MRLLASKERQMFWLDKIAREVVDREERLNRGFSVLTVESGIGASGFPHIGSAGDSLRAYGVKLALEDLGRKSRLVAFSDDRDGLRKVPAGVPSEYAKYIGMPVTDIPDPWGCHESYGAHMSSMLIDALDKLGVEYEFYSGTQAYKSGLLDEYVDIILRNHDGIEKIVREEVGTSRPEGWIPYWPVCEECGRIYTTRVIELIPEERKVVYVCDQEFKGVRGCGHRGEAKYVRGTGKLPWKWGEFAARWAALGVVFEPHGKDIADSFRVNAKIAKEILGYEPPLTIMYEMFLDATGEKISKSKGNVITPQDWLKYAPPESLRLLMFKRYKGTRAISLERAPEYVEDLERHLRLYWNLDRIPSERDRITVKRLVEYTYLLKGVPKPPEFTFRSLISVIGLLPWRELSYDELFATVSEIIADYYGLDPEGLERDPTFKSWFERALNYVRDIRSRIEVERPQIDPACVAAIGRFLGSIDEEMSAEDIQAAAFETCRSAGISPKKFFAAVYTLLVGAPRGPRLGPLVKRLGVGRVKSLIRKSINYYTGGSVEPRRED